MTTTFVMDLNSGLTQALSDGTNDYIYGLGRIAQVNGTNTEYFLGDALGSVRQLTDSTSAVTFAQGYAPYGSVTTTSGSGSSSYGFTNEYQSQGKIYLRARHYLPSLGRFLTRDIWGGDANRPMSFNRWGYTEGNPVNYTDPSGQMRYPLDLNSYQHMVSSPLTTILNNLSTSLRYNIFCHDPFERVRISEPTVAINLNQMADYGVTFAVSGNKVWSAKDKLAALLAVYAVGIKFKTILGGTPASAFRAVYGYLKFTMGNCPDCKEGVSGYTYGAHDIRFNALSTQSDLRRRNHVVHELGHAFKWALYQKTGEGIDVYSEYTKWRQSHSGYPDRPDLKDDKLGQFYGFASRQNDIDWQQSTEGKDSEEFADQFLGWTFNMWEKNKYNEYTTDAKARISMMNSTMPCWVKKAAGKSCGGTK